MPLDELSEPLAWLEDGFEDAPLDDVLGRAGLSDSLVLSASSDGEPASRVASAPASEAVWHRGQTASPALSGVAHSGHVGTRAL
jgi:hypothetical protein